MSSDFSYQYIPLRGLTAESLAKYSAKTKVDAEGKPIEIGFRYPNGAYKVRDLEKKEFRAVASPSGESISSAGLFGSDVFSAGSHRYVTITEGEFDAIALHQVLGGPVVSVQSATSAARDVTAARSWINSHEGIYLCFDADAAGRRAVADVARLFDYNKVFDVKLTRHKDANAYVEAGEGEELRKVWWNARKYQPDSIISTLSDFKTILESKPVSWGTPYPWPTLNAMTYGIRTGESVLITAQEGVGKTEIMHAIEHKILKETDHAVGAIFLEEPKHKHLQILAGIELGKPVHLPDQGGTTTEIYGAIQDLVRTDGRLNVYNHFGSDDPNSLLDAIRFLVSSMGCRYILLDHITMACSGLASEQDERRALDYIATRLEVMVVELDFALIVVSHINDDGKTRGSRMISKLANIRIDASRDTLAEDIVERHTIDLVMPKNRPAQKTGRAGRLIYYPEKCLLTERTDAEASNDNSFLEAMAG